MSNRLRYILLSGILAATGAEAKDIAGDADSPAFSDDRSTARNLVESYYNAIALGQYARAFTYRMRATTQESAEELNETYQAFRDEYEQFATVKMRMGEGFTSPGTGLEMTAVPIVVETRTNTGAVRLQTACNYVVQLSPSDQDFVPYEPIRIDHIEMRSAEGGFQTLAMPDCRF